MYINHSGIPQTHTNKKRHIIITNESTSINLCSYHVSLYEHLEWGNINWRLKRGGGGEQWALCPQFANVFKSGKIGVEFGQRFWQDPTPSFFPCRNILSDVTCSVGAHVPLSQY